MLVTQSYVPIFLVQPSPFSHCPQYRYALEEVANDTMNLLQELFTNNVSEDAYLSKIYLQMANNCVVKSLLVT